MWTVDNSLQKLRTIIDSQLGYHSYQLARYMNDVTIDLNYFNEYADTYWNYKFWNIQDPDLAQSPKINVIKEVIDTLVSKISNQKCRPYFTPVNGLHSTKAIMKQAQQYFDIIYDKEHVHDKITQAFRNACIFGIGYVFYNPFLKEIEAPGSWQIAVLNTEQGYAKPTKALVEYKTFPTSIISNYGIKGKYQSDYVNLKLYFDTVEHKMIVFVNDTKAITKDYKADVVPLVPVYNTKPVFGTRTVSLVDELDGIQTQIDILNQKISTANQLTPANVTYVEAGSSLQPGDVSSKTGLVYSVKMGPGHNNLPVVNVTPAPLDPSWMNMLEKYTEKAYETAGTSKMSVNATKPSGIDSGVGLQTLADIESERFQTQLDSFVNSFVNLANLIIDVADDDTILPKSINTAEYSWEDVRKQKDLFKVQFSAMSILSKDPQTKIQQIAQLSQLGLISADEIAARLDSPDLENAYKGASAIKDAIDAAIENAITKGTVEIPDYISYQQLLKDIIVEENQLFAAQDTNSLNNLGKLKEALLEKMNEDGFVDLSNEPETEPLSNDTMSAVGMLPEQEAMAQANAAATPVTDTTVDNDANLSENVAPMPLE